MFDTVRFYTDQYQVKNFGNLQIMNTEMINYNNLEKKILFQLETDDYDNDIRGDKAFINDTESGIFFTIKHIGDNTFAGIQCSLPNLIHNKNYLEYDFNDYTLIIDRLNEWLNKNQIEMDIENSEISRLDTTFNCFTDSNINNYFSIFKNINISRLQKFDYGSTFLFRNGRRQITVYDKKAEVLAMHTPVKKSEKNEYIKTRYPDLKDNQLRFEYRLLKSGMIKKKLKDMESENIIDLYVEGLEQFYNLLDARNKSDGFESEDLFKMMLDYNELYERKFFDNFLKDYALYKMFETFEPEKIMAIIDRLDLKPYQRTRIIKACREGAKITLTKKDTQHYVDEIKRKLDIEIKKAVNL